MDLQKVMARKKKSSPRPTWLIALIGFAVVVFIGSRFFNSQESDPYRTIPLLSAASYLENSNSLRGNTYKLKGTVAESLAWSPTSGRLIAINVDDEQLPLLVTPEFNSMNIQKEQNLIFVVEVDERGILRTKKISKS
jgi:hypothetical protein